MTKAFLDSCSCVRKNELFEAIWSLKFFVDVYDLICEVAEKWPRGKLGGAVTCNQFASTDDRIDVTV